MKFHCSYDKLEKLEKLVPNPKNPNTHSEKQIELLAKIIDAQGFRAPITVSKRSGFVIRGHGRLLAAQKLELEKIPVDYQDYENESQEWADMIADNRIAELSFMDKGALNDLLHELDIDIELAGFTKEEFDALAAEFSIPDDDFREYDESIEKDVKKVVCPHCGKEIPV